MVERYGWLGRPGASTGWLAIREGLLNGFGALGCYLNTAWATNKAVLSNECY